MLAKNTLHGSEAAVAIAGNRNGLERDHFEVDDGRLDRALPKDLLSSSSWPSCTIARKGGEKDGESEHRNKGKGNTV